MKEKKTNTNPRRGVFFVVGRCQSNAKHYGDACINIPTHLAPPQWGASVLEFQNLEENVVLFEVNFSRIQNLLKIASQPSLFLDSSSKNLPLSYDFSIFCNIFAIESRSVSYESATFTSRIELFDDKSSSSIFITSNDYGLL